MAESQEDQTEVRKYKSWSRAVLAGLSLLLIFLGFQAIQLQFDYDFEKFFPEANDDLEFYQNFRETFENDNDFVLVGVQNKEGIFREDFLRKVQNLSDDLKSLPHIREVISPLELSYLKKSPGGFGWAESPYFHVSNPEKYAADSSYIFNGQEPVSQMISKDARSLAILIKNDQLISKVKSDELATALQEVLDQYEFDRISSMGKIMGQKAYIEILKVEFLTFMLISIFVLIIFLILTYRSLWGVFIPLLTVMLAVVGSLGFMKLSGSMLNMMTTLLPVIMLVVGMSDVIHLVSKYLEEVRMGRDKITALKNMLKKVGIATLLTSLTTALGFVTLIGVNMKPVQDFGIFTALGVILAFVLSILFIPAIFMLIKKPKIVDTEKVNSRWDAFLSKVFLKLCKNRKKVFAFYGLLTVLSIAGASQIKFDYYLMQDLGDEDPLMQDLFFFQENFGGVRPFELALIPQGDYKIDDFEVMEEIVKLEAFLESEYQLGQMASPTTPYKMLNKSLRDGRSAYFKIPENKKRYDYLKEQLSIFENQEEFAMLLSKDKTLGRINGRLVDPGSRAMLMKNERLLEFKEAQINQDILDFRLTGTPVIIDQSGRYVSKNIILGLFVAFFIIALSMGFLFRSIKMAFLSLVPNLFPLLLTAGFIGFAGIDLNMTTAIVFTIAFGIAVDDTIHFLSRYRQEMRLGKSNLISLRRTFMSTGKAIIITTIILLGGFGSLLFSDFLSTFYIGLFVSMTLVFALITDLTLLPMLLMKKSRN